MEQERALISEADSAPVFAAYRRGYDPEQVDRYIGDQRHRLDEALERASEAERRLAAAVGQLRELHRRVAMLESENRSQTPPLDMLGERVQRILQEAWEGAYQLRQAAEQDVNEQREQSEREVNEMLESARRTVREERLQAEREVAELLETGQRKAMLMRAETERRRQAFLEQVQEDREQAVDQISRLHEQRHASLSELQRIQATLEATVAEMARSPIGVPSIGSGAARQRASDISRLPATLPDDMVDVPLPPLKRSSEIPGPVGMPAPDPVLPRVERPIERFDASEFLGPESSERRDTAEQVVVASEPEPEPEPEPELEVELEARSRPRHARGRTDPSEMRSGGLRRGRGAPESTAVFDFEGNVGDRGLTED